jgi:hypothetical protein
MTGNIRYFPAARVKPLNITMSQLTEIVKNNGAGSRVALRGTDLHEPAKGATVRVAEA